jgi:AcrR family transcriptional regulator
MSDPVTFAEFKEKEREAKKRIILQAAIRVFGKKSLNSASMREIAEEAGISHASIYRYFRDKQALFVEAFLLGVQELQEKLEAILRSPPEEEVLQLTAQTLLDYLSRNEHYFAMMTQVMLEGDLSEESVGALNSGMRSFLDRIEAVARLAGAEHNVRYLSHTFFACLNGILISFYNYPGRSREDVESHMKTLARVFIQMFTDGIRTGSYNHQIPGGRP